MWRFCLKAKWTLTPWPECTCLAFFIKKIKVQFCIAQMCLKAPSPLWKLKVLCVHLKMHSQRVSSLFPPSGLRSPNFCSSRTGPHSFWTHTFTKQRSNTLVLICWFHYLDLMHRLRKQVFILLFIIYCEKILIRILIYCCLNKFQLMILNKQKTVSTIGNFIFYYFLHTRTSVNIHKFKINIIKCSYCASMFPEEACFKWEYFL